MVNLHEFFRKTYAKFTNWKLISSFWCGKVDIWQDISRLYFAKFSSETRTISEIVSPIYINM
jgi:hypothetical protein